MRLATRSTVFFVLAGLIGTGCDSHTITTGVPAAGRIALALPKSLVGRNATLAAQTQSTTNSNGNDSDVVAIRVRISLAGESRALLDKTLGADTVCNDSSGDTTSDQTVCVLSVDFNYPAGSERSTFTFTGDALDPLGVTVYKIGPAAFTLGADGASGTVTANAVYVGPGSDVTGVVMSPRSVSLTVGGLTTVSCSPTRAGVATSAFAPLRVTTANPLVAFAFFTGPTAIQVVGLGGGTTRIACALDFGTHAEDAIDVTVTGGVTGSGLQLQLVSGGGQTANVNSALANPVFVRVVNSQGQPVSGVLVATGVGPQSGFVSPTQGVTSVSGIFSTQWTLGPFVGQQSLAFAIAGAPGLLVTATGR